jgi:hypothetical protein
MNGNNLAIIVPIHFPKIEWLKKLCESYNLIKPDIDLYIVVSEEEQNKLNFYQEIVNPHQIIICPNVNSSRSPVTYKKMHGLHEVYKMQKYYGYACVDSESLFINTGFEESFMRFYNDKVLYCYPTDVDFLINIQHQSSKFFKENEELKKFKKMYSVWNTIPWFVDQHLGSYFKDIKYDEGFFFKCDWEVFDQLSYQAWLISKNLYKISDIQYRLEYPEDMKESERNIFKNISVDWIRFGARNLLCFANNKPLMYFHTDRDQG